MNQFLQNSSKILKSVSKNPQNSNYTCPSMSAAGILGPNLVILRTIRDAQAQVKVGAFLLSQHNSRCFILGRINSGCPIQCLSNVYPALTLSLSKSKYLRV